MHPLSVLPKYAPAYEAIEDLSHKIVHIGWEEARQFFVDLTQGEVDWHPHVLHARTVNRLEFSFHDSIHEAAGKITALCDDENWIDNDDIMRLWHRLARVVTIFSEHPTPKKVATLIVDDHGLLQAYGVNRMPDGIPRSSWFYEEGIRKYHVVCSERNALTHLFDVAVQLPPKLGSLPKQTQKVLVREAIIDLDKEITQRGQTDLRLKKRYMFSTEPPCRQCTDAIPPHFKGIFYGENLHSTFTRAGSIADALAPFAQRCEENGVLFRRLPPVELAA